MLQRVSGVITLIFVTWHVFQTRFSGSEVDFNMMAGVLSSPFMFWFYLIGVISTIFHFSNGLWSFLVSWGVTISPRSQVITTYITMGIFVLLSIVGIRALVAFI